MGTDWSDGSRALAAARRCVRRSRVSLVVVRNDDGLLLTRPTLAFLHGLHRWGLALLLPLWRRLLQHFLLAAPRRRSRRLLTLGDWAIPYLEVKLVLAERLVQHLADRRHGRCTVTVNADRPIVVRDFRRECHPVLCTKHLHRC